MIVLDTFRGCVFKKKAEWRGGGKILRTFSKVVKLSLFFHLIVMISFAEVTVRQSIK